MRGWLTRWIGRPLSAVLAGIGSVVKGALTFLGLLWSIAAGSAGGVAAVALWPVRWFRRHPTLTAAMMVFAAIGVVLGPALWWIGGWALIQETTGAALAAFRRIAETDPEKTVEAYGKLVAAMGLLVAAPVGLLGVGLAFWRTWNQHRDGVVAARKLEAESYAKAAEAFAKAVDHLGSEKPAVRLGAILALEALGKAEPRLLSQAIEILCAFVRDNRPVATPAPAAGEKTGDAAGAVSGPVRPPTDFQLAVTIIARLKRQDVDNRIRVDLSGTDLGGADLLEADLRRADLRGADLGGAFLYEADLSGADLSGAKLRRANLSVADLSGADLGGANLSGAVFKKTRLPRGAVWSGVGAPPAAALTAKGAAPAS